jgi:hypothetical protein
VSENEDRISICVCRKKSLGEKEEDLDHADMAADFVDNGDQLFDGGYIDGYTQIGLLGENN